MQGLGLGSGCEPSLGALPWGQGCASPCPRGPDKEPPSHSAKAGLHGGGDYAGQGGRQRGRSDSGQTPGSLGSVSLLMKSFSVTVLSSATWNSHNRTSCPVQLPSVPQESLGFCPTGKRFSFQTEPMVLTHSWATLGTP